MRALALIDGEHYAEVVVDAFRELEDEVVGAVALGGTDDFDNFQALCTECNAGKAARPPHAHDLRDGRGVRCGDRA